MSQYQSEHLSADHNLDVFDSGNSALDDWLRRSAKHAEATNTGRTFVWVDPTSSVVVGYFTLAAHLLRRAEIPKGIGHGSPNVIPAILLARLALDHSLQGLGLGGQLLLDALERAVDASNRAAARVDKGRTSKIVPGSVTRTFHLVEHQPGFYGESTAWSVITMTDFFFLAGHLTIQHF